MHKEFYCSANRIQEHKVGHGVAAEHILTKKYIIIYIQCNVIE